MRGNEEKKAIAQGHRIIGAIDEAGRGPLAGPVVAACVICPAEFDWEDERLELIKDSKQLAAKERERLFKIIYGIFPEIGIGICDNRIIDRMNIFAATFLAMKMAIGRIKNKPDFILLDGKFIIPNLSIEQKAVVAGDKSVVSIAAASIIAKVTRDRIMFDWHERYPHYGFDRHKGYGTKFHFQQLSRLGPCPIHRQSFSPVRKANR
ncbi:ribonuclease HII [Candidatus Wolfebacteria bacterium RBG_13_41_7]|uniref:Ribonuclease HII n=1 Tax=Candidatus Wolfebacteria bacterium RBG_13_41_7 TaxID=1802554 RepID=A0A1F8DKP1_9BACT|nr:MAG: ribonuclease HII [Candidatus Wolfebacteria bacterium RBG_13_41_7]